MKIKYSILAFAAATFLSTSASANHGDYKRQATAKCTEEWDAAPAGGVLTISGESNDYAINPDTKNKEHVILNDKLWVSPKREIFMRHYHNRTNGKRAGDGHKSWRPGQCHGEGN